MSEVKEEVMRVIRFEIDKIERDNAKTHEKTDRDMIKNIYSIIKKEVNRSER